MPSSASGRRPIHHITEPGIIAAESPNAIVNNLVIMPDIEKRLEAFVRTGHGIIVFPGGVGTAEEILYLLGILLHPKNAGIPFPLIFSGPAQSAAYFEQIDAFLKLRWANRYRSTTASSSAIRAVGAPDRQRHQRGSSLSPAQSGRVLLQLGAYDRTRVPTTVSSDAREHGRTESAPRAAASPAGGRFSGAALFRVSSRATRKEEAIAPPSPRTARSSSTATTKSCVRWINCWQASSNNIA